VLGSPTPTPEDSPSMASRRQSRYPTSACSWRAPTAPAAPPHPHRPDGPGHLRARHELRVLVAGSHGRPRRPLHSSIPGRSRRLLRARRHRNPAGRRPAPLDVGLPAGLCTARTVRSPIRTTSGSSC
jgi:hypothetical protein